MGNSGSSSFAGTALKVGAAAALVTASWALSVFSDSKDDQTPKYYSPPPPSDDDHQNTPNYYPPPADDDGRPTREGYHADNQVLKLTPPDPHHQPRKIKLMCYNIWSVEVKLHERMEAIGKLIQKKERGRELAKERKGNWEMGNSGSSSLAGIALQVGAIAVAAGAASWALSVFSDSKDDQTPKYYSPPPPSDDDHQNTPNYYPPPADDDGRPTREGYHADNQVPPDPHQPKRRRRKGTTSMGNSESSSQFPPPPNVHDAKKFTEGGRRGESTESSSAEKALKVAPAAGGALLARGAYSLASSSSSNSGSSDEQRAVTKMEKLKLEGLRTSYDSGNSDERSFSRMIKILSYNVWFREDVEVHERMKAIGRIIQQYSPDVIFFQEVTPNIYDIFQSSNWWKVYKCSVLPEQAKSRYFSMLLSKLPVTQFLSKKFENSTMERELCVAAIEAGANKKLTVATSHLESPTPGMTNSAKRVAQAEEALSLLNFSDNVVFGGDMNWDEMPDADGPFPLLDGWYDPWSILVPREDGWTYDVKSNGMLRGMRPFQTRLDRFACKLRDFRAVSIKMVGTEAIPGISWYNKGKMLPVLPCDHYGLLLTICPV